MTSYSCTCGDPKAEVCHTHKTIRISWHRFRLMQLREFLITWNYRIRWAIAQLILGEVYFNTGYTCPKCANVYCPAKPGEIK